MVINTWIKKGVCISETKVSLLKVQTIACDFLISTVIDVYQQWSGPCKGMVSIFKKAKIDLGDKLFKLAIVSCTLDVQKLESLLSEWSISTMWVNKTTDNFSSEWMLFTSIPPQKNI